ncbi:MAG: HAD family hydrolase [Chloroflexota bacterium]|nr:MAG: HAD family hydrolase [Chloroflexota bacterium]
MAEKATSVAVGASAAWHNLDVEQVLRSLGVGRDGLSSEEALHRLTTFGPNELRREARVSLLRLFLHQFESFLVVILLIATGISVLLGELLDAVVILIIVLLSAVLGLIQEHRASRALEALRRMAAPTCDVVRGGEELEIPARELVPGDLVLLMAGDRVPADGRIVESFNLSVDESALTGESQPVDKQIETLPLELALADRTNLVYAGTTIIQGRGLAVVVATGMRTEFGKIAHLVQLEEDERQTPLERRMGEIGRRVGVAALALVGLVVVLGMLRGEAIFDMFLWGISLAVAAVPEALPAVVTGALAIGVQRMARRGAIVRHLPAVETLGSVTVICSDKTGTLTRNEMTVRRVWTDDSEIEVTGSGYETQGELLVDGHPPGGDLDLAWLGRVAVLCNDARLVRDDTGHHVQGDPTEGALLVLAAKEGCEPEPVRLSYPRLDEIPFSSVRRFMATLHVAPDGGGLVGMKGSAESVLVHCSYYRSGSELVPLNKEVRDRILAVGEDMARQALRVLALASLQLSSPHNVDLAEMITERRLTFEGLVGMIDPPRDEARGALAAAEQAGVRTIIITGDHRLTAVAIATDLGLMGNDQLAITGAEMERLSDGELEQLVDRVAVYARAAPEHKLRLVSILQKKSEVAAMTGDGINDAPALRRADIGIAMGISGTDVTREASDLVLADDNYATIVAAIAEGRVIYDNIRKFIRYLLSTNAGEILTMFLAVLIGLPVPLLAIQILWINLVTDGLPALALGVEVSEQGAMLRPPRHPRESIFARGLWQHILWVGAFMAVGTLAVMVWGLSSYSLETARTMVFLTLAAFQMAHVLAIRSERASLFMLGLLSNPYLAGAVALTLALQFGVIYIPVLRESFQTTPLDALQLLVCLGVASSLFWAVEFEKWMYRRRAPEGPTTSAERRTDNA